MRRFTDGFMILMYSLYVYLCHFTIENKAQYNKMLPSLSASENSFLRKQNA